MNLNCLHGVILVCKKGKYKRDETKVIHNKGSRKYANESLERALKTNWWRKEGSPDTLLFLPHYSGLDILLNTLKNSINGASQFTRIFSFRFLTHSIVKKTKSQNFFYQFNDQSYTIFCNLSINYLLFLLH